MKNFPPPPILKQCEQLQLQLQLGHAVELLQSFLLLLPLVVLPISPFVITSGGTRRNQRTPAAGCPVFAVWLMDCKWPCHGSSILILTFVCSKVGSVLSLGLAFVIQMHLDHQGYFVETEFLENTSRYCRGHWQSSNSKAPLTKHGAVRSAEVTCNWTSATGIVVVHLGLFK